jgi:hypothetical protein
MPFAASCILLVTRPFENHSLSFDSSTLTEASPFAHGASRGASSDLHSRVFEFSSSGQWTDLQ